VSDETLPEEMAEGKAPASEVMSEPRSETVLLFLAIHWAVPAALLVTDDPPVAELVVVVDEEPDVHPASTSPVIAMAANFLCCIAPAFCRMRQD
jgi:hypothetical protein